MIDVLLTDTMLRSRIWDHDTGYFHTTIDNHSKCPFFKIGTTTACFMGAGNTVVASEALMIRASRGERASMCCLTIDVGSGSSSHDFVADASTIFFTSEGDACYIVRL